MIHIFFPSLLNDARTRSHLSKEEKQIFYEKGLRPAVASLLPTDVSDWPATYDTELFRAQKRSGHMAYQTKMLPQWVLLSLVSTIRAKLARNSVDWGTTFFFTHTVRGTKDSTQHSRSNTASVIAFKEFLTDASISERGIRTGQWWVDVGLEFSSGDGACLQWRTSSHFYLVKEVLQIQDNHAHHVTSLGSSKYSRDIVSHLPAVSGCRIEPGAQAEGQFKAAYFQIYTTDKAITYNPEGRYHGKAITIDQAMGKTQPPAFIEGLFKVYRSAISRNSSNARIEIRVPLQYATTVLLELNIAVV
jgi:hypothetical protein